MRDREPPLVLPVLETAPMPRGPFFARFLRYHYVRGERTVPFRYAYAPDPAHQNDPLPIGEAVRDIIIASEDPDSPGHRVALAIMDPPFGTPPRKLPRVFAPDVDLWVRDAWVAADELPDDVHRSGQVPEDLYLSRIRVGADRDRFFFLDRPAASPRARARQRIDWIYAHGGIEVTAVLVQANYRLYERGDDDWPAVVVFSPDSTVRVNRLRGIAEFVYSLKDKPQTDPDRATLSRQITIEAAVTYRRRRVPTKFTGGADVVLADIEVYRAHLRRGYLEGRQALRCVAEPGETGALELLPESPPRAAPVKFP